MATHKSSEKRARQDQKISTRNAQARASVKTWEKKLRVSIAAKKKKESEELLITFMSKIDKAAQKGVVHRKAASRSISRLSKQVSAL